MKKVIITGSSGMLGQAVAKELNDRYALIGLDLQPSVVLERTATIDLTDEKQVAATINEIRPDAVIHCAALTNVSLCEREPAKAEELNVKATFNIAQMCRDNVRLIYISTAAVFKGDKGNYTETDPPEPINVYALTKLAGEQAARLATNSVVIRTDIIGWKKGQYMVQGLYEKISAGEIIDGYINAVFSPISVNSMARLLAQLLENEFCGILHIGSRHPINKYEFSIAFAHIFGFKENLIHCQQLGAGVKRPQNTSLDVRLAIRLLGPLPVAEEEIRLLFDTRSI